MPDLSAGAEFAGCRIEAVAGRGGMGVVYRAIQLALERSVALKVIAPDLARDDAFRARFQREARIAASIEHPNVLPVYEAGERDGVLFLITRYVEGTDLRALLRRDGPLAVRRAAALLVPVALALQAAHARGLVHRDVKPANVLLAAPGEEDEHVYLTDFGIARGEGTASGEMTVTRTGAFVGTLDYMAPERMTGERGDARSDVYAFGCMLFQALAGRVPFPREQEVARIHAHINEAFPTLLEIRSDVPPAIDAVVQRACAKNPDDRFASAAELAKELQEAAGGDPAATAETHAPAGPPTAPMEPPTGAVDPAAEAATAPVRPRQPKPRAAEPTTPSAPPAPTSPTRRRGYVLPGLIGVVVIAAIVAVVALSGGGAGPSASNPASTPATATSPTTPSTAIRLLADSGPSFTIDRPSGWSKRQGPTGGHIETTTWTDPAENRTSLRVDAIPRVTSTPRGRADSVRSSKIGVPGYSDIDPPHPATIARHPGVEWRYRVGDNEFVDYFVNLDCGDGYAVLGRAPVRTFPSLAATFRRVADSLRSKGC